MKRPAKVCAVVTARPSYSRIFTALRAIDEHDGLELSIVTSGSAVLDKYGSVHDAMAGDGFEVTASVHMVIEGDSPENMARTTGLGLLDLPNVFSQIQPDSAGSWSGLSRRFSQTQPKIQPDSVGLTRKLCQELCRANEKTRPD